MDLLDRGSGDRAQGVMACPAAPFRDHGSVTLMLDGAAAAEPQR